MKRFLSLAIDLTGEDAQRHFSFVLSIDSENPDRVLAGILTEVIDAINDGQFRDSYLETDHTGSWRFWEGPTRPAGAAHPSPGA